MDSLAWRRCAAPDVLCAAMAVCLTAVAPGSALAQLNPLIPPLPGAFCKDHWRPCPTCESSCLGPPPIAVDANALGMDPRKSEALHLTIQDAVFVALDNSRVVRNLGLVEAASSVDLVQATSTAFDPFEARALAAAEWGIFDPLWTTRMQWDRFDIPPGTSFGGIGVIPPELDTADFSSRVEQLLPVGSRISTEFVVDYLFNPDRPPSLDPNPQHFSFTQFSYVQPLMRGLGQDVTLAPIRIAAAEAEQTDFELKLQVLALVRSVETTYWSVYREQEKLNTLEEMIPRFREVVRIRRQQAENQLASSATVSRAESDLFRLEQQRLDQVSRLAEQQLVLRNLMGLPPSDGRFLALASRPSMEMPVETVDAAVATSAARRPDVLRQRLAVYVAQQECLLARDAFSPILDFNAFWRINGLDNDLIGSVDVQQQNDFNDWQLGVTFEIPLGRRQGRQNVRAAQFGIQRERALLQQVAFQASYEVTDAYRRLTWLSQQLDVAAKRLEALAVWRDSAKAQFDNPPPGVSTTVALELYLQTLRDYQDASNVVVAVLADFNSALARLEETKGTLLDTRLVAIDGDTTEALPDDLPTPAM